MWEAVTIVLGALAAVGLGSPVTLAVFAAADRREREPLPHAANPHAPSGVPAGAAGVTDEPSDGPSAEHPDEPIQEAAHILRGGLWIGLLERLAVYAALLLGAVEVIAMVLAVKGLGRYPELRSGDSPGVAERFIIGTFVSVLWAAACAGAVWLVLHRVL